MNYGNVHGASMLNGGIAGRIAEGSIYLCINRGAVNGGDFTGGVVGAIDKYSSISFCFSAPDGSAVSESGKYVGGVVGIANCAVENCYNDGSVTGSYGVGGVVGWTTREIRDCHNAGAVTASSSEGRVGGVVGNSYGLVENCYNEGSVDGTSRVEGEVKAPVVGGVCGHLFGTIKNCRNAYNGSVQGGVSTGGCVGGAQSSGLISGCTNEGAVSGVSQVGGVIGMAYCLVTDCTNLANGRVNGSGERIGGVIGCLDDVGRAEHIRNEGTVTGVQYVGGLIGMALCEVSGLTNDGSVGGDEYVGGVAGLCNVVSNCSNNGAVKSETNNKIGGIVGACNGSIASCTNTGTVEGKGSTGGIVGALKGTVMGCANSGSVTGTDEYVGGVLGYAGSGTEVSGCSNAAAVSGTQYVGGVVGNAHGDGGGISDCRNTATVTGSAKNVGGVVGSTNAPVSNCENSAAVSGTEFVGGVAGLASDAALIYHCLNTSSAVVTGTDDEVGGIVGAGIGAVDNCVNEGTVTGMDHVGGIAGSIVGEDSFIRSCFNTGNISGADGIGGVAGRVGKLADDADPSGLVEASKNTGSVSGTASVGGVAGVIQGTVRDCENNGAVVGSEDGVGGVVGYSRQGSVVSGCKNLKAITAGTNMTAGIVGANKGEISDCVNEGTVTGGSYHSIGGIVGDNSSSGTLTGCSNKAKISSNNSDIAGVVGVNHGTVNGCSNAAAVTGSSTAIGGIIGENNGGTISNCANTGSVTGRSGTKAYTGGIVGYGNGSITGCTNGGAINAGEGIGGIAGFFYGSSIDGCINSGSVVGMSGVAGGIAGGIYNNSNVLNCSNTSAVYAPGKDDVGGIIGVASNNNTVTNCTNTGNVTGNNCVGGILGENGSSGTYSKLTNSGTISGNYETGGIAGDASAALSDCLNTGSVTGSGNSSSHGTGGICGRLSGKGVASADRCKNTGTVSGTYFVGGIVGMDNDGSINNSENEGPVSTRITGEDSIRMGGIVGYIQDATLYKCVNYNATINGGTTARQVGGIAGGAAHTLIDFCRNYATVQGGKNIGGIVGLTTHIDNNGTIIQRCINSGHVTASIGSGGAYVGGIVGNAGWYTTINECANNNPAAKVQAPNDTTGGGIAGVMYESTVSNCYNTGYVYAYGKQGGIVGEMKWHCTMATCFNYAGGDLIPVNGSASPLRGALAGTYDKNATTFTNNYYSYYLGLPPMGNGTQAATAESGGEYKYLGAWGRPGFNEQSAFSGFNFSTVYMMQSDRPKLRMEGGVATYTDTGPTMLPDPAPETIRIYTVEDLANLRDNVNRGTDYSKTTIFLEADLDMSGINWTPIGSDSHYFNGFFEGQGHTVYNLAVNTGGSLAGLFGAVSGTVQDLDVRGSVMATSNGTVYAGGIVGAVTGGTIRFCSAYVDVYCTGGSDMSLAGGVAGFMNTGTISNCFHVGDVEGAAASSGLVGIIYAGTLENCFHYLGRISASIAANGITYYNLSGTVKNCYVLSGTSGPLFSSGTGTNCAFKSAAEFKDTTLGLGNSWLCGGEHPELLNFSWMATLRPNGGTGTDPVTYGVPFFRGTLPSCPFYRDGGWTFIGWNTRADGTGTWYDDCGSFATDETLYAQWLQGWKYNGYSSATAELFDNDIWSAYHCLAMERGETAAVNFTTNDAVRPCAIAFYTTETPSPIPPSWRLEAKVHASDGDWTVLGESDGGSLSNADKVVFVRLAGADDGFYSAYRLVWQGPSDYVGLLEAWLLVSDPDADVRRPLILHSNDGSDQTKVVEANNGDSVTLINTFTSENRFFLNWNTKPDGTGKSYANYEKITVDGVTDLYAQWLDGTHYHNYTALKTYDQFTELDENGVPKNDSQYLGYDSEEYGNLVDDVVDTKWCVKVRADAYWSLEFTTDEYVKPVGYVLVTAEDTATNPGRNPKNWTLEGLSKEGAWVMLDGILQDQSLPAANHAEICRKVGNDQEYNTFRITFRGLTGGTTFQLSEMYLITDGASREPSVTFDSHGGTGNVSPISAKTGRTVTLPECSFTRKGFDFTEWNTKADGTGKPYAPGKEFIVEGDSTLYAQWTPSVYTVRFLDENGEPLYETTLTAGQLPVYKGPAPGKEGDADYSYVFTGWDPIIVPVDGNTDYTVKYEYVENVYAEPVWKWSDELDSATASFRCITDPSRTEKVTTKDVTAVTTAPTCTEKGNIAYTATVVFRNQEYSNTQNVPIDKLGHAYTVTGWEWDGYEKATAQLTCSRNEDHKSTMEATVTPVRTEPTCEKAGKVVYTASVTVDGKTYTDKKTETIKATGHAYELTEWNWTGYTEAIATFTCKNDTSHVTTVPATITPVRTEPTCEGAGKVVYTAEVTFGGKVYKDKKTETLDPINHAYELTGWEWTGYSEAIATFTCKNDSNHVKTEKATITPARTEPTCEKAGKVVYTAKVTFEGKEYTNKKTETIKATGHAYELTEWNWTGYTEAIATFTCQNDISHVTTVPATITPVRTEPTADDDGKIVYTAEVVFEDKSYKDQKTDVIPALGRDYELTGWVWDGYSSAEASFTDKNGSGDVTMPADIKAERTEPTCEKAGKVVYTATVVLNGKTYTDKKTETLKPIGHAYEFTEWNWTGYTVANATFTCKNDASHVTTEKATVTAVRTEPTCEGKGKVVYTAEVVFENKTYTDKKTVDLDPIGHAYELTEWKWTGYTEAVATFTCKNNADHVTTETATITSERTEPTCEKAGKIVYTATVVLDGKTYTDKATETLKATGHAYELTGWSWTGYTEAEAVFTCKNDASHVMTAEAEIEPVRTEPTADNDGKIVYTATVEFENNIYTDKKTEVLPALGREYELTGWAWDGYASAEASFTDKNGSGDITVTALISVERTEPTCEETGLVTYTAKVTLNEKTYTDKKTETLNALDHEWGEPVYVWADGDGSVTATVTCERDESHVITETVSTNFILTQYSTYKADGAGYYVATFENELFSEQKKEVTIPSISCDGGPTCPSKAFTDVPSAEEWIHLTVDWAVVNHVTYGTSATTFSPDEDCTRAQFVTFLWRTMGQPETTLTSSPFKDVAPGTWYYTAVLWAYENHITLGTSSTTFSPNEPCSRSQVVTFLWRMEGCEPPAVTETKFEDVVPGEWYYDAVLWATERGITQGVSETAFCPDDTCTRVQCVAFIFREFAN
ncbi:MAG: S-layer homology domain-containing protein [Clostridia bacterium]|nr:S-layer homology domain-containing protein [Clostridia bacterium]